MIRSVFFDNDGVLVDTERLYFEATRQTMATHGVELTRESFQEYFLRQNLGAWHLLADTGYSIRSIEDLKRQRDALYGSLLRSEDIEITGAETVLAALHGRLTVGVVTSSHRDHFAIIHERTGFGRYFDFVVDGDDCEKTKPDPEPYRRALERAGVPAAECLVIEDSERGLVAAKAAGLRCWVIPTDLNAGSDFSRADAMLGSIGEVPDRLERG
ncbi:MAG TPA: HAD family phosphatase [Alphaproteobacteria bacterium]|jgi:HAD superfamily hydrolase (TIGR01509 family)|nr:HAD family phosphatase [Alphaproteobacteria bacterium]HJM50070.1 HAD family phosphatase [Alphaproteobacteria bacterium]|tara:strand:+ start:1793 stop:2434 length:642 start_codon:yes stop_codon:yes gene_type:complete